jgi:hypothetical protein
MTARTPLPFRVLVTAAPDAPVASLARQTEDDRLIITACATEDDARRSLIAGLPDLGILDGSLPGASLLRIYTELRPEQSSDHIPVLFTNHAMDASAVADGIPDVYLAGNADLHAIHAAIYQSLGIALPEPAVAARDPLVSGLMSPRPASRPWLMERNPLAIRALRNLPLAAMIAIGGFAGVMTFKNFDTRSWPFPHPIEASAATPPVTSAPAIGAMESFFQALTTRAVWSTGSPQAALTTPAFQTCELIPAVESLREQVSNE